MFARLSVGILAIVCSVLVSAVGVALALTEVSDPALRMYAVSFFAVLGIVWAVAGAIHLLMRHREVSTLQAKVESASQLALLTVETHAEKEKYKKELRARTVAASPFWLEAPGSLLRRVLCLADELDAQQKLFATEMKARPEKIAILMETLGEVFEEEYRREAVRCTHELLARIEKLQRSQGYRVQKMDAAGPDECLVNGRIRRGTLTELAAYLRCLAEKYAELCEKSERVAA
ncbi:MAG: hypothetical protein ACLPYS_20990 [Vulcanimicrobiaceae bacterium]